jgi:hypothetical protein
MEQASAHPHGPPDRQPGPPMSPDGGELAPSIPDQRPVDPRRIPGTPEYSDRQEGLRRRSEEVGLKYGKEMLHEMLAERKAASRDRRITD